MHAPAPMQFGLSYSTVYFAMRFSFLFLYLKFAYWFCRGFVVVAADNHCHKSHCLELWLFSARELCVKSNYSKSR